MLVRRGLFAAGATADDDIPAFLYMRASASAFDALFICHQGLSLPFTLFSFLDFVFAGMWPALSLLAGENSQYISKRNLLMVQSASLICSGLPLGKAIVSTLLRHGHVVTQSAVSSRYTCIFHSPNLTLLL
jgi:hypothetical protein